MTSHTHDEIGPHFRAGALLILLFGIWTVGNLGWEFSVLGFLIGSLIGLGFAVMQPAWGELGKWLRVGVLVVATIAVELGQRYIESAIGVQLAAESASAVVGMGLAALLAGIGMWVQARRRPAPSAS